MESLCTQCFKDGETRLLLTDIPFFRQVVLMSFECPHCGFKNNELQDTNSLGENGQKITLKVTRQEDLGRSIVRSQHAVTFIPELGMEIPATKKGYHSTLEGFMVSFKEDLMMTQEERRKIDPAGADQIDEFLFKLEKYVTLDEDILPFSFILDDPSGTSYIQNLEAPKADPNLKIEEFTRTKEQIIAMGYNPENVIEEIETRTVEEINEETKEKFSALRKKYFPETTDGEQKKKPKYS